MTDFTKNTDAVRATMDRVAHSYDKTKYTVTLLHTEISFLVDLLEKTDRIEQTIVHSRVLEKLSSAQEAKT